MISRIERLYLSAPPWAQQVLVTLKGLQVQRQRMSGSYRAVRRMLKERRLWNASQFAAHQATELSRVLASAAALVPFYRELATSGNLGLDGKFELEDVAQLPRVSKELLRERPGAFVAEGARGTWLHTTGTTGTPVRILASAESRQINYAFFDDYLSSIGVDPGARRATLAGRMIVSGSRKTPPFWVESRFQHTLFLSSYHLGRATLGMYVKALERFRPQLIDAYPSAVFEIAQWILTHGGTSAKPRAIMTSSETLYPEQREVIEEAFRCRVFNQYGAAEMVVFAGECVNGRLHYRPDFGLLELLDGDGLPVAEGDTGQVVATGFANLAMPLIRYELGDSAAWGGPCDCGLVTPTLREIGGRRDDVIVLRDGRRIGRLSPVLKGFPVRAAQYVQRLVGRLEVVVVPGAGFDEDVARRIRRDLQERLGPDLEVEVCVVDNLARGEGGKLRAVVSLINHARQE